MRIPSSSSSCTSTRLHVAISSQRTIRSRRRQLASSAIIAPPASPEVVAVALRKTTTTTRREHEQDTPADDSHNSTTYRNGLLTVALITVLFASNSPVVHAAFSTTGTAPPVLLLNALTTCTALAGVTAGGPLLDRMLPPPSMLEQEQVPLPQSPGSSGSGSSTFPNLSVTQRAGMELGVWKSMGTIANLYGLCLTSASHGAFLIQLTTLFVPLAQGLMGTPITSRVWTAIAMALAGVVLFTQDAAAGAASVNLTGDLLCVVAAVFYATYDLRLYEWGQQVAPLPLITTKVATQAAVAMTLAATVNRDQISEYLQVAAGHDFGVCAAVALWSGLIVNGIVPYLQVGGQQAVGPAKAQILYASQPLWAALMSCAFLGETVGVTGMTGGVAFLGAMLLAATGGSDSKDTNA